MIPADLGSRLGLATETSVQPLAPIKEIASDLPGLVPGMRISARIESLLSNGNVRATVGGQTITLSIASSDPEKPVGQLTALAPGQTLDLTVLNRTARVLVTQLTDTSSGNGSAATSLSRPGQLISALLAQGNPAPAPLARGAALVATPDAQGFSQLPGQLHQAVSESGLFYESHQVQWLAGQRPTEALLREPQGAHSPLLQRGSPEATPGGSRDQGGNPATATATTRTANGAEAQDGSVPEHALLRMAADTPSQDGAPLPLLLKQQLDAYKSQQPQWQDAPPPPSQAKAQESDGRHAPHPQSAAPAPGEALTPVETNKKSISANPLQPPAPREPTVASAVAASSTATTAQATTAEGSRAAGLPADLTPLVQQQLDAASTGHLMWTGQIWPGQSMEWHIESDGHRADSGTEDPGRQWKSTLRLTLPKLGLVDATLTLTPAGVSIALATGTGSEAALRAAVPQLDNALSAAGVPLTGLQVQTHEQP